MLPKRLLFCVSSFQDRKIWKWNKYLFCKKTLISAEERCLQVLIFFFSLKSTVGNWSRSKIQCWSISLYDLHTIFLSISLIPSSFNTHCCFLRNRFPAEWCVATCPPNETRKIITFCVDWGHTADAQKQLGVPQRTSHLDGTLTVYSDDFIKRYSRRNNAWTPGAGVRQILYHSPPPRQAPTVWGNSARGQTGAAWPWGREDRCAPRTHFIGEY